MTRIPKFLKVAFEAGFYVLVAFSLAWGAGAAIQGQMPAARRPILARSASDADKLKRDLHLADGRPAIVEFMDFQCPPCRAAWPKIHAILSANPDAQYRHINFPLQMHPYAFDAAVASEVAVEGGAGDEAFAALIGGATGLDSKSLNRFLSTKGLPAVIGTPKAEHYRKLVIRDMNLAGELRIDSTPTIFVLQRDGSLYEVSAMGRISGLLR